MTAYLESRGLVNMQNIKGGYYMKARKILKSDIAHAPPHVREIFDLFLCKAFHSDGDELKRGQLLITYDDIREALYWMVGWRKMRYSKWDCEKALKWLRKATMIATKKTTAGTIVTICNYSRYQTPENYENHTRTPLQKATRKPQSTDTIDKNSNKNIKNDNKDIVQFETFWKAYPRKQAKAKAKQIWLKIKPAGELLEKILDAIEQQRKSEQWQDARFIPLPTTWLNQERWGDELPLSGSAARRERIKEILANVSE